MIDRLLASPHYGERWGRHWLDLARYADTNGYEFDEPRPDAWRYRDYVIRSFNADKPYDRFILEQLAGDEAFPGDPEALVATGFNLLGPDMTDASDQVQRRLNTLNDMTDTAGARVPRADGRLRPVPRPQVRADPADRLLPPAGVLRAGRVPPRPARRDAGRRSRRTRRATARVPRTHEGRCATRSRRSRSRTGKKLYEAKLAKLSPDAQDAHRTPPEKRTGGQLELVAETERGSS